MHKNSPGYFKSHDKKDVGYYTEDGHHFFSEGGADAHAQALKKKDSKKYKGIFIKVTRAEFEAAEKDGAKSDTNTDGNTENTEVTELQKAEKALAAAKAHTTSCKEKLDSATLARDIAKGAKEGETAETPGVDKTKNTKTLTKATQALDTAQAEYDEAVKAETAAATELQVMQEAAE